jgi:hypothetical protein
MAQIANKPRGRQVVLPYDVCVTDVVNIVQITFSLVVTDLPSFPGRLKGFFILWIRSWT